MDVREKLVELFQHDNCPLFMVFGDKVDVLADYLIAHGVTVQKWIPVSERLPEEPDRYLCNVKSFAFPGRFYHAILQYDKHGFREGNIYTDDVTHWMPLPEPPKGD